MRLHHGDVGARRRACLPGQKAGSAFSAQLEAGDDLAVKVNEKNEAEPLAVISTYLRSDET